MQPPRVSTAIPPAMRVGCSGWMYRHWKGDFYPADLPQARWFGHYAAHFDTVEINASFYRMPTERAIDAWRAQARPGFCYALKANRYLTHLKKLVDCEGEIDRFLTLARRLGPALGPLLYQLPPSLHIDIRRLDRFLARLPRDLEHVVEFRHASWYQTEVLACLDAHGVGFVAHDLSGLVSPQWSSGRTAYVRLHGTGGRYVGRYAADEIARLADWLIQEHTMGRDCWAFFNNDIHGHAIRDALALQTQLASRGA